MLCIVGYQVGANGFETVPLQSLRLSLITVNKQVQLEVSGDFCSSPREYRQVSFGSVPARGRAEAPPSAASPGLARLQTDRPSGRRRQGVRKVYVLFEVSNEVS